MACTAIAAFAALAGCGSDKAPQESTQAQALDAPGQISGFIDRVDNEAGQVSVSGWACTVGTPTPIWVHIYTESEYGHGPDTFVNATYAAYPSEQAVSDACQDSGIPHRFSYTFTAQDLAVNPGSRVWLFGINAAGGANEALHNGGMFTMPMFPATTTIAASDDASAMYFPASGYAQSLGITQWSIEPDENGPYFVGYTADPNNIYQIHMDMIHQLDGGGNPLPVWERIWMWQPANPGAWQGEIRLDTADSSIAISLPDAAAPYIAALITDLQGIDVPQDACTNFLLGQQLKDSWEVAKSLTCVFGTPRALAPAAAGVSKIISKIPAASAASWAAAFGAGAARYAPWVGYAMSAAACTDTVFDHINADIDRATSNLIACGPGGVCANHEAQCYYLGGVGVGRYDPNNCSPGGGCNGGGAGGSGTATMTGGQTCTNDLCGTLCSNNGWAGGYCPSTTTCQCYDGGAPNGCDEAMCELGCSGSQQVGSCTEDGVCNCKSACDPNQCSAQCGEQGESGTCNGTDCQCTSETICYDEGNCWNTCDQMMPNYSTCELGIESGVCMNGSCMTGT